MIKCLRCCLESVTQLRLSCLAAEMHTWNDDRRNNLTYKVTGCFQLTIMCYTKLMCIRHVETADLLCLE